jgi:hypothetical protein
MEMETLSLGQIFQGHSQKILGTLFGHDGFLKNYRYNIATLQFRN